MQAEVLNNSPDAELGEGALWFRGSLYWVDILGKRVWISQPDEGEHRSLQLKKMVSTIVPRQAGGFLVTMQDGFYTLDALTGDTRRITDPVCNSRLRFNDGKCDPAGRFWAGTMPLSGRGEQGSLYVLDVDGTAHHRLGRIRCSNGICWSQDSDTMYYIDTGTQRLDAYDYTLSSGYIGARRTIAEFDVTADGRPDGMAIDVHGNLWIAMFDGGQVICIDPRTGQQVERIGLPVSRPTSCCFGGPEYRDLYITTARLGETDEPEAGHLFVCQPGVRGLPSYLYAG